MTDLGVDAAATRVVTLRSLDDGAVLPGSEAELAWYSRAHTAAAGLAGVESAALSVGLPFMFNFGISERTPESSCPVLRLSLPGHFVNNGSPFSVR